jgi:UDP-2,3-diacylglucosamine pyrophosphatase LpxH
MAITKQAKNINILVKGDYNLIVGGKLEKVANKMNIEATNGNLTLISNKKIIIHGDKR